MRLTRREFELLRYLVQNKNRVVSRDRLLERVWGYDRLVETRSVDVHVGRLRGKLGEAGRQIETVVGLGLSVHRLSSGSSRATASRCAVSSSTSRSNNAMARSTRCQSR